MEIKNEVIAAFVFQLNIKGKPGSKKLSKAKVKVRDGLISRRWYIEQTHTIAARRR